MSRERVGKAMGWAFGRASTFGCHATVEEDELDF